MQLSAYTVDSGRTVLSLTAFDSATSSRLVVLGGDGKELANISVPGEIRSVRCMGTPWQRWPGGTIYAYSGRWGKSYCNGGLPEAMPRRWPWPARAKRMCWESQSCAMSNWRHFKAGVRYKPLVNGI